MQSLWMNPEAQGYPALSGDLPVDVAIIGAGFSGLGAAWALRESGLRIAVLEDRTVASGASGRNAGFVLAGPAAGFGDVVDQVGSEAALAIWKFTVENNRLLTSIVEEYEIECGFLRRGSMSLASSDVEMAILRRTREHLASAGLESCLVTAEDLPRPFDRMYRGGLYYPGNGEVNPAQFLRTLAGLCPSSVSIFERSGVVDIEFSGEWRLKTARGCVTAQRVLVCTNAYTGRLFARVPIAPTRGQVVSTAPLGRVVVPFPMYANHGYQYWRQTSEGRLVVGGWRDLDKPAEVGYDEELHPRIHRALDDFVWAVGGPGTAIDLRWAGVMGFTPDMFPLVGSWPSAPGLFISAGFSGHGVAMAFLSGARTARMALDDENVSLPDMFDPGRFLSGAREGETGSNLLEA